LRSATEGKLNLSRAATCGKKRHQRMRKTIRSEEGVTMRRPRISERIVWGFCVCLLGSLMLPSTSHAATARAIDEAANRELDSFREHVNGADAFLMNARGVLVFPEIIQAGIGIGGQYGEGVLRIGGGNAAYYSIAAGSFGFQLGAQRKSLIVVFMDERALRDFRAKARAGESWNVGVDGSIALLTLGGQASIDSATINQPIVGFVFDQRGLMYSLSLQGAKITQIER
jgi:lipid-binding SYLF domain-containing protein